MLKSIIAVGLGGFIGSIARYLIGLATNHKVYLFNFPLGTLIANVAGSLLLGIFLSFIEKNNIQNSLWGLLLITGFCGGFTTFSTFTFENFKYLQNGQIIHFMGYTLASFLLALAMIAVGFKIGNLI